MFLSISNQDYDTFPENLILNMSVHSEQNNFKILSFTIIMEIIEKNSKLPNSSCISFVGSYSLDTNELSVSEKCKNDFKNDFYFNKKILVPDLFRKYILPKLSE